LTRLHDSSQINTHKRNNVRREPSWHFRNKGRECPDNKVNNLETHSKNKKNCKLVCRHNEFKKGYQSVSTLLLDEKGELLAQSHSTLSKRTNDKVCRVNDVRQAGEHS